MKKLIYVLALAATLFTFFGCNKEPVEVPYVKITTNKGEMIANGATYDPNDIEYIDVTFDQPMDTSRTGFLGYWFNEPKGDTWTQIYDHDWVNDYTFRIYVYLLYNKNFQIAWNDETYEGGDYTKKDGFFKSKKGAYAEYKTVYFKTSKPASTEPKTYEIDFTSLDYNVKLAYNKYGDETSEQQFVLTGLNSFLNHDYLRAGDTITFKYCLPSPYDISDVHVNLVDGSRPADYWKLLTADPTGLLLVDETFEPNKEYEGSLTFDITADMVDRLDIQFFAPLVEDYYGIRFIKK